MKMKRSILILAVIFAVAAVGTGAALGVSSRSGRGAPSSAPAVSPTAGAAGTAAAPATVTSKRKLKGNYISQDSNSASVGAGFQPIDALTTINCPSTTGTSTCTIEADQHAQVSGSTAANSWAICTQVDGAFIFEPACPFLGVVPSGSFTSGSFAQSKTGVSVGNHTVQSFLFTNNGGSRNIYEIVYRVYVP